MFITHSLSLDISHSQVAVFDRSLERPFNLWTERHVAQGFTSRPGSAAFRTLEESRLHRVSVIVTPADVDVSSDALRVIQYRLGCRVTGRSRLRALPIPHRFDFPRSFTLCGSNIWLGMQCRK
jgi:hypothetical protein